MLVASMLSKSTKFVVEAIMRLETVGNDQKQSIHYSVLYKKYLIMNTQQNFLYFLIV